MSDIHNAAVLLMTLPEEQASDLMSKLDPKQVEQVSLEIARTRTIASDEQERVIKEFTETNPSMGGRGGGLELAKSLLQKALGTGAAAALVNIRQSIEATPFGFLRNVDSQNLLTYIIDEHPQTIALIMSHLPANFGAEILAGLPEARRLSGDSPHRHDGPHEPRYHQRSGKGPRAPHVERDEPKLRERRRRRRGGRDAQRLRSRDRAVA